MVKSCSAINCSRRWKKGDKIKFHRFPKDPNLRKLWVLATRRDNFNPSNTAVLCNRHFGEDDYETNVHGNLILKKKAIPLHFDFPAHLIKVVKKRRPLCRAFNANEKGQSVDTCTTFMTHSLNEIECMEVKTKIITQCEPVDQEMYSNTSYVEMEPSTTRCVMLSSTNKKPIVRNRRDPIFFGDFKESDLELPERRKKFWNIANETVSRYKKMNKYYQSKMKRLRQKL